jgi:DNA-binding Lrp family transcriptional regulator
LELYRRVFFLQIDDCDLCFERNKPAKFHGMEALDKLDKLILRSLQADGRATYDHIAEAVSLSPSAVLRRVKRLEESGVIDRYVALVKPEAVGWV